MLHIRFSELVTEPSAHRGISKQVYIRNDEAAAITQLARVELPPTAVVASHAHPSMDEVFFVVSGSLLFSVNGRRMDTNTGDVVVVTAGEAHQIENRSSDTAVILYLGTARHES